MGNIYSDLDVFIIRESNYFENTNAEYIEKERKTFFINLNNINLDVEVFNKDYVLNLSNELKELKINKDVRIQNIISYDFKMTNEFLNRFLYSICIKNEHLYIDIKNNISYDNFFEYKKLLKLSLIDGVKLDITGNLSKSEIDTALYQFRNLIFIIFEIILSKEKISVDRDKWIILKFMNFIKIENKYNNFYKIYLDFFRKDLSNENECSERIKNSLPIVLRELEKSLFDEELSI